MTVKERLTKFIQYKQLNNSQFCRSIGVSSAFVSSMVQSIQPDKIERIALNYPDLNTGWLLTGEGEMLKVEQQISLSDNSMVSVSTEAWNVIKKQADSLAMKDQQMGELIAMLKKVNALPESDAGCVAATGSDK